VTPDNAIRDFPSTRQAEPSGELVALIEKDGWA